MAFTTFKPLAFINEGPGLENVNLHLVEDKVEWCVCVCVCVDIDSNGTGKAVSGLSVSSSDIVVSSVCTGVGN